MNSKKQILFPKHKKIMEQVGENIKLARKRRKLTTIQVSERAGIDRSTLYQIEKGSGSVSMAAYFNTLRTCLKIKLEVKAGIDSLKETIKSRQLCIRQT